MTPFHLAIAVKDLPEARKFYGALLGLSEGRSSDRWIDFNMFGHQLVVHLDAGLVVEQARNSVDGHSVPVPHFGVVMAMHNWRNLAQRLRDKDVDFLLSPYIRFEGQPGAQGTFFIQDPSGNALEFKGFEDLTEGLFGAPEKRIPVLETGRLKVTLLRPAQAQLMLDYVERNRAHLQPWEPERSRSFFTLTGWQNMLDKSVGDFYLGKSVHFVALSQTQDAILASCNLTNISGAPVLSCNMGYSVDHGHQGTGLMFELAEACISYAFKSLGLHRVTASHMPTNTRSEKLLSRLGFEREGIARNLIKINGRWEDHVLNALVNHQPQQPSSGL